MVSSNDIHIQFLKQLSRYATDEEVTLLSSYLSIDAIDEYILTLAEYKNKHNIFSCNSFFDVDMNIFHIDNITGDSDSGCILTNGTIFVETATAYNQLKSCELKNTPIPDFTRVVFKNELFDSSVITNHSQMLDMNRCKFVDTFDLHDNIHVSIEKIPIHEGKEMFLQKITLSSAINITITLVHQFTESFVSYTNQINNASNIRLSLNLDNEIRMDNLYIYDETYQITYKGCVLISGVLHNCLSVNLVENEPVIVYILTRCVVASLPIKTVTFAECVALEQRNFQYWSNRWNTRIYITNKSVSYEEDNRNLLNFYVIKGLFDIYSSARYVDYLYEIPICILTKPELARERIELLIQTETTNRLIYEKALTIIHIWNYYRVSLNKSWLSKYAFAYVRSSIEELLRVVNQTDYSIQGVYSMNADGARDNNALTNYLVSLAIKFTNQMMYEMDELFVKKYRDMLDKVSWKTFSDSHIVQIEDTAITIKLGSENGLYHIDFFETNTGVYLGYRFGGAEGKRLNLRSNTLYTFVMDSSLALTPIRFQETENKSTVVQDTYTINSDNLIGYSFYASNNTVDETFRLNWNHLYGENAFVTENGRYVITPYDGYDLGDSVEYVEPYLLFNAYYNTLLYENDNNLLVDMIDDNINYYRQVASSAKEFNKIHEAGLHGLVANYKGSYLEKKTKMDLFYNMIMSVIHGTETTDPWANLHSKPIVFIVLTCLLEVSPKGSINHSRFVTEAYGLKHKSRNVLPRRWKQLYLSNVGDSKQTFVITNALYTNDYFMALDDPIEKVDATPIVTPSIYNYSLSENLQLTDSLKTFEPITTNTLSVSNDSSPYIESTNGVLYAPRNGFYLINSRWSITQNVNNKRCNAYSYLQKYNNSVWLNIVNTSRYVYSRISGAPYGTCEHYMITYLNENDGIREVGKKSDSLNSDAIISNSTHIFNMIDLFEEDNSVFINLNNIKSNLITSTSKHAYVNVAWSGGIENTVTNNTSNFGMISDHTVTVSQAGSYLIVYSGTTSNNTAARVTSKIKAQYYNTSVNSYSDVCFAFMYIRNNDSTDSGGDSPYNSGVYTFIQNKMRTGDGIRLMFAKHAENNVDNTANTSYSSVMLVNTNLLMIRLDDKVYYTQYMLSNTDISNTQFQYISMDVVPTSSSVDYSLYANPNLNQDRFIIHQRGTYLVYITLYIYNGAERDQLECIIEKNGVDIPNSVGYTYMRDSTHTVASITLHTVVELNNTDELRVKARKIVNTSSNIVYVSNNFSFFTIIKLDTETANSKEHVYYNTRLYQTGDEHLRNEIDERSSITVYGTPYRNEDSTESIEFLGSTNNFLYTGYYGGVGNDTQGAWSHSVSFWMYVPNTTPNTEQCIYCMRNRSDLSTGTVSPLSQSSYVIHKQSNAKIYWRVDMGESFVQGWSDSYADECNEWIFVVVTYNGQTNEKLKYSNGIVVLPEFTTTDDTTLLNLDKNVPLLIGKDPRNTLPYQGKLAHFRVYDTVLSPEQIYMMYNPTIPIFGTLAEWKLIKALLPGTTQWFKGNDNLVGYSGSEFLFTTGDFSRWLIADHEQVNGAIYSNALRTIKQSSISETPYQVRWYNRGDSNKEDPWVSLEDHSVSVNNTTIMYGENSWSSSSSTLSIHATGMYVYTR